MKQEVIVIVLILMILTRKHHCARILGVFPSPGYSQFILAASLMKELATRGHDVTVISPFSPQVPVKNYKEVNIADITNLFAGMDLFEMQNQNDILNIMQTWSDLGLSMTEYLLSYSEVQNLIHSNKTFDVVIVEQFLNEAHMGFGYHFKAPLITFSSTGASEWTNLLVGNPAPPSYIPNSFSGYSGDMDIFQRVRNLFFYLFERIYRYMIILPSHDKLLKKYFPNAPDLSAIIYNTSIVLLNSHPSVTEAVPLVQNMIEIGGFHISNESLPADVKEFLDNSRNGAVFFSMGSNLRSKDLKDNIKKQIFNVLGKLEQNVLWKFEDDSLPENLPNVRIKRWLPQRAVLGHRNVKAFISHCGLISTIEAVCFGVPLVCIPIYGDQKMNAAVSEKHGIAVHLPFKAVSEDSLSISLRHILYNESFRKEIKKRSIWMKDRPVKPMDAAIYWIEYIIRHGEAPHLRSASIYLTWYQYLYLDALTCALCLLLIIWGLLKLALKRPKQKPKKSKKQ